MRSLLSPRTLATVAAALLLCVTASPADARTPDGAGYQEPGVGECRDLTQADAMKASDTTPPIACADPHTVRVIAVPQLPADVSWDDSDKKLGAAAIRLCGPAANEALGRTYKVRARSAYSWVWFTPTKAQREHGARWIRCDLALVGGTRLVRLPTDKTPALPSGRLPDKVARCLTPTTFVSTTCARKHAFRATGAFILDGTAYPTAQQFRDAALKRCPRRVSTSDFRWTYRGKYVWKQGDHTVVCYSARRN